MDAPARRRPVALLTGGAGALVRGCIAGLVKAGFDILVLDCSSADLGSIEQNADEATIAGLGESLDDPEALPGIVEHAWRECGGATCLVNAASTAGSARGDILDVTRASLDLCLQGNVLTPFILTQHVSKRMMADRAASPSGPYRSVITLTTSALDHTVALDLADYALSKAALSAMCRHFSARLAPEGIGCFEVRPGLIAKDGPHRAQAVYDRLIGQGFLPMGRWGQVDEVGSVVAALARGDFRYSVGQIVNVDGGMGLKTF